MDRDMFASNERAANVSVEGKQKRTFGWLPNYQKLNLLRPTYMPISIAVFPFLVKLRQRISKS